MSAILPSVLGLQWTIRVDELAAVMVDLVLSGPEEAVSVLGNAKMVARGREFLKAEENAK